MAHNKTRPTNVIVEDYLSKISGMRFEESKVLIAMMRNISGEEPVMWGPSIIGFGNKHYKYDTGREGDIPRISFSPRKASITVYFSEGFDRYATKMQQLGAYKASVSCLYIAKLENIDTNILKAMLEESYAVNDDTLGPPENVDEYIKRVPAATRPKFDELRHIVTTILPNAHEVLSYGIVGYKIDDKRARVFISGWKDHLGMYPIPKDAELQKSLKPYIKGKGTLWFRLDKPLPKKIIVQTVRALVS